MYYIVPNRQKLNCDAKTKSDQVSGLTLLSKKYTIVGIHTITQRRKIPTHNMVTSTDFDTQDLLLHGGKKIPLCMFTTSASQLYPAQ